MKRISAKQALGMTAAEIVAHLEAGGMGRREIARRAGLSPSAPGKIAQRSGAATEETFRALAHLATGLAREPDPRAETDRE